MLLCYFVIDFARFTYYMVTSVSLFCQMMYHLWIKNSYLVTYLLKFATVEIMDIYIHSCTPGCRISQDFRDSGICSAFRVL